MVMNLRAWAGAYVAVAALGVLGLALLAPRPNQPEALAICRAATPESGRPVACLDGLAPSILTAELAGTRKTWSCQLFRAVVNKPGAADARCAELRSDGLRDELRRFDTGFFIPLYTTASLLLAGWLAAGAPAATRRRRVQALAVALALATAVLAALDGRENRAALAVLDAMDAWNVAAVAGQPPDDAAIHALAAQARQRSLEKWAASAAWVALAGAALWVGLRRLWPAPCPWWWRWAAGALALAAWLGAACFAAGTVQAWGTLQLALPVQLIGAGMGLSLLALVGAALAAGVALWAARRAVAVAEGDHHASSVQSDMGVEEVLIAGHWHPGDRT
jgi:hypothetical protein